MEETSESLKVKDTISEMSGSENIKSNEKLRTFHRPTDRLDLKLQKRYNVSMSDSRLLMKRPPLRSKVYSHKDCFRSLETNKIYHSGSKIIIDLGNTPATNISNSETEKVNQTNTIPSITQFENDSRNSQSSIGKTQKPIIKVHKSNEKFVVKKRSMNDLKVVCLKGRKTVIEINNTNPKLDFSVFHQKTEGKLIVTICDRTEQFACNYKGNTLQSNTLTVSELKCKEKEKNLRGKGVKSKCGILPLSKSALSFGRPSSYKDFDDSSHATILQKELSGHVVINGSPKPCFVLPDYFTVLLMESLDKHNKNEVRKEKTNNKLKHVVLKTNKSVETRTKRNPRKINKRRNKEEHILSKYSNNTISHCEESPTTVGEYYQGVKEEAADNSFTEKNCAETRMKEGINSSNVPAIIKNDQECMMGYEDNITYFGKTLKRNNESIPDLFKLCSKSFNAQQPQRQPQPVNDVKKTKDSLQKPKMKKKSLDEEKKVKFDIPVLNNISPKKVSKVKKPVGSGNYLDLYKKNITPTQTKVVGKSVINKKKSTPLDAAKKSFVIKSNNLNSPIDRKYKVKDISKKSTNASNLHLKQSKMSPTNVDEKSIAHKRSPAPILSKLAENNNPLQSKAVVKSVCFDPTISFCKSIREKRKLSSMNPQEISSLIRNKILGFVSILNESGSPLSTYGSRPDTHIDISYPFSSLPGCNFNLSSDTDNKKYMLNKKDSSWNIPIVCENEINAVMNLRRHNQYDTANNLNTTPLEKKVTENKGNEHYPDNTNSIETLLFPISRSTEGRQSTTEIDEELTEGTLECNGGTTDINVFARRGIKRNVAGVPTNERVLATPIIPLSTLITIEQSAQRKNVQKNKYMLRNLGAQNIIKSEENKFVCKINNNILPVIRSFSKLTKQLKQLRSDNEQVFSSKKSHSDTVHPNKIVNSEYTTSQTNIPIHSLTSVLSDKEGQCKEKHDYYTRNILGLRERMDNTRRSGYCIAVSTSSEGSVTNAVSNFFPKLEKENHEMQTLELPKHNESQIEHTLAFRKSPNVLKRDKVFCKDSTYSTGSEFVRADEYFPEIDIKPGVVDIRDDNYFLKSSSSAISFLISPPKHTELEECEASYEELEGAFNAKPASSFYFFVEESGENNTRAQKKSQVSNRGNSCSLSGKRKRRLVSNSTGFMKFRSNYTHCTNVSKAFIPWVVPSKILSKKNGQSTKSGRKRIAKENMDDDSRKVRRNNSTGTQNRKKNKTMLCYD